MTFEFGKKYIVDVTERGITPLMVFDEDRWYDKDHDDLDFLTDEEKIVVINDVLDKIRAEIEEYKSRQLALAIGVDDLEKGKQIALEYVLAILDKYKAASEKGMSDNFEAQSTNITIEMHPKEAIEILEYERDNDIFVTTEHRARIHQALTMGIKALKAQIKADESFNNTDSPMIRVNLESVCKDCYYNDEEVHGQCIICDKYRVIMQDDKRIEGGEE